MRDAGFVPQTGFALYEVELESKEELLSYHSENLAIAFALTRSQSLNHQDNEKLEDLQRLPLSLLLYFKIVGHEIVLQDSNRFRRW
ncbi:hypothetical protein Nepgr_013767 [Nepenthes gracilis]|uniref:DYW domain-containing protein n=1 Tax=Nepenthes gracilis TaxID=150966 RepID=A0AAD3XPP0_NEPGR|nr:hypothetical protein Nepgr_013767 [Nepenthes gracilis]